MNNGSACLKVISGVGAKGPACFLVEAAGKRLMLDLGEGPPPGLLPDVDGLGRVDAVVLSHGHKDHVGGLSLLPKLGNPPVYATEIVARGLPQGIAVQPLPVGGNGEVLGIAVETGRNGHAPGGIWLRFAIGDGLLYTGDFSAESILYAYDPPPPAATALMDCSYGGYDKPIAECWKAARAARWSAAPCCCRCPPMAAARRSRSNARAMAAPIFLSTTPCLPRCNGSAAATATSVRDGTADEINRLADIVRPIGQRARRHAGGLRRRHLRRDRPPPRPMGAHGRAHDRIHRLRTVRHASRTADQERPRAIPCAGTSTRGCSDTVALAHAVQAKTMIPAFCDRSQLAALAAALAPARVTMDGPG